MGGPPRLYSGAGPGGRGLEGAEPSAARLPGPRTNGTPVFLSAGRPTDMALGQWRPVAWLSGFTICLRDGVTNGNKCVSFTGNTWESSCPTARDPAGGDGPGPWDPGPCRWRRSGTLGPGTLLVETARDPGTRDPAGGDGLGPGTLQVETARDPAGGDGDMEGGGL
ncbi:hypothetical protein NHX12_030047 [Muraenolepis orangiensis]|uniref:Uncharacterized protein n=1 Tax=Muraenolepis orangiensis TaxID=630683 RepID=A0A9Q0E9E5_9TELE|nr:hypothetical protein NHX12_030047 [Muraenolepis orangiensis]